MSKILNCTLPYDAEENANFYTEALSKYSQVLSSVINPNEDESTKQHKKRGKLLVRERIAHLIDPGSPFLELSPLAGEAMYDNTRGGAGIVTGIGIVHQKPVMIVANDATVKGGAYFPMTVKKHLRAQEIALENSLPCIYLVDSGGAFLPLQDEVFPDKEHFGRIFFNQAHMSANGIAQIAVVMGSCTAGGAYIPAMCDESIIVQNQGTIFLGGPPLVKAATGEEISAEELGGGNVHCEKSGVCDYLAVDDYDALEKTRELLFHSQTSKNRSLLSESALSKAPLNDPRNIISLIPKDSKKPFPMKEILSCIIDNSEFDEFKELYGTTIICGFAKIDGILVGIIANNGILFSESALKAAQFVQLCDKRRIPLIFFHNITGFMVGSHYEHNGIAKDGAKLVTAVSCTTVPKISVVVGGSFGAGNYGMCGRAFNPRFLFTWPTSRVAVMGPSQAAAVLTQVKEEAAIRKGLPIPIEELKAYRSSIESTYIKQSDALYATSRLWDDGIIEPVKTRDTLSFALRICKIEKESSKFGIFRM